MIDKPDNSERRSHMLIRIVPIGALAAPGSAGIMWMAVLLGILLWLNDQHEGIFLVPPFAATMSILLYCPVSRSPNRSLSSSAQSLARRSAPCSACSSASVLASRRCIAHRADRVAFAACFHPPGVALAMFPALLHPGPWFAVRVVLPFTLAAVISSAVMCRLLSSWPRYPAPLRTESGCREQKAMRGPVCRGARNRFIGKEQSKGVSHAGR